MGGNFDEHNAGTAITTTGDWCKHSHSVPYVSFLLTNAIVTHNSPRRTKKLESCRFIGQPDDCESIAGTIRLDSYD